MKRPLLVMDRNGGTEAASFIGLSSLLRQLHYDRSVDIYSTAKTIHNARPGVWKTPDHILHLYRGVEALVSSAGRQQPEGREERLESRDQY
jgi:receptor-type tyrosine-protein phosphatase gamma